MLTAALVVALAGGLLILTRRTILGTEVLLLGTIVIVVGLGAVFLRDAGEDAQRRPQPEPGAARVTAVSMDGGLALVRPRLNVQGARVWP